MRATAALLAVAVLVTCGACGGGTQDVVPDSHDVVKSESQSERDRGSYAHVAKRSMGFVALAGEQGVDGDVAVGAVERLADSLDACATNLAQRGKLVDGAVRVRMTIAPDGAAVLSHVDVAPGNAVAANAILCVLAPLKMLTFPPAEAGTPARTMAIDATWGPLDVRAPGPAPASPPAPRPAP